MVHKSRIHMTFTMSDRTALKIQAAEKQIKSLVILDLTEDVSCKDTHRKKTSQTVLWSQGKDQWY